MKAKRYITLVALVLAVVLLAAGCARSAPTPTPVPPTPTPQPPTPVPSPARSPSRCRPFSERGVSVESRLLRWVLDDRFV